MLIIFALLFSAFSFATAPALPNMKLHSVTVSGISSGAFQAVQLQVALSEKIRGAASVAGGIYGCAEGQAGKALQCMMMPGNINSETLIAKAKESAEQKLIDPLSALATARIYLFQSKADKVVKPEAETKLKEFFSAFTAEANLREEFSEEAAHGFLTLDYGNACDKQGLPWIQNCARDGAGEILGHLYGALKAPSAKAGGQLMPFDQTAYTTPEAEMLPEGRIYVPSACAGGGSCRLHIALHGCQMSTNYVQEQFVEKAGYNRWADTNNIVVLYPQVDKGGKNPNGCWDWFGYTGADYAQKSGKQIQAITKMMEALGI
jgi:predicted esterase